MIDSLRIGTVGGLDHDVGVFHKLEVLAAGAAFLHLIEHGGRFEQGALFIRHDALLDRITQRDVDRVSRVNDQTCRWAVAAVLMSDTRWHDQHVAFDQLEIALGGFGDALVLHLNLGFAKSRRSAAVRSLR